MKSTTFTLAVALAVTASNARRLPEDNCCRLWDGQDFSGQQADYCVEGGRQDAFTIQLWRDLWNDVGSIKCGKNVDATICPFGFVYGPVDGQREFGYKCNTDNVSVNDYSTDIGAGQNFGYVKVKNAVSSIVLSLHPWVAKGTNYLSLDRDEKEHILWNKIIEDDTINEAAPRSIFPTIDVATVFDESGDEFDCRIKTVHPQGNVGMAEWRDLGDHNYTGIFQGADTGFVRLSTQRPVIRPEDRESNESNVLMPTIALKFLRDGMDSANSVANQNQVGQPSYNFFEKSLYTNLADASDFDDSRIESLFNEGIRPETNFVASLGNSEMASFTQDGEKVDNPIFPYSIKYKPNPDLSYEDENYEKTVFERLRDIPVGTVLYQVFAFDKPTSLGGEEVLIGEIVLRSELRTSMWGDKHMFFRHQRHDDDLRYHSEWIPETPAFVKEGEELKLHPHQERRASSCPFQWLFDML